jgi:formylglycine-generating enzyme required for sulfatase activity
MPTNRQKESLIFELGSDISLEMNYIPAGDFMMGSGAVEHESPVHQISIPAFWMGRYAITQKQWRVVAQTFEWENLVLPSEPAFFKSDQHPIEQINWYEAVEFCGRLSLKFGHNFRLPREAEWEYACRAGTTSRFLFGDDKASLGDYAWFNDNSLHRTHPVGQKLPNSWGLYDIIGNTWEWCEDRWRQSYDQKLPEVHLLKNSVHESRLLRGASWNAFSAACASTTRNRILPSYRAFYYGLRVVCDVIS